MKNKKTRRFKIRYIVFGLLGVMALAALVFMRFGGFGTGENVNPKEFLAYAEPVENITVPESAKIIALGEANHGNAAGWNTLQNRYLLMLFRRSC